MHHHHSEHCNDAQSSDFIVRYPIDTPDVHGYMIMGHETIFLNHFAMFAMANHQYQVILEVEMKPEDVEIYWRDRIEYPNWVHVLGNSEQQKLILPDIGRGYIKSFNFDMYRGFPFKPDPTLLAQDKLHIKRIVAFRHFDLGQNAIYTPCFTYYLYGKGREAHLAHYITTQPDFQHELDLVEPPDFLTPEELEQGVLIMFPHLYSSKNQPLITENPLPPGVYEVAVRGKKGLYPIHIGETLWFDTTMINEHH